MNIKKYRHACLILEKDGQSLVIDPGEWSEDFVVPKNTVGLVITHEHGDHFDLEKIHQIVDVNSEINIFAHVSIIAQLQNIAGNKVAVEAGQTHKAGVFDLKFVGGSHASIHPDYPVPTNFGVIVNNGQLYYPGDSFTLPECIVENLAVPASAPWMKIAEAMDFITAVKPKKCFPTHNALLSDKGHTLTNSWLAKAAEKVGADFQFIDSGR